MKATGLIAAAGSGERLGAGGPKAFVPLGGRPMLDWSLDAFRAAPRIGAIVVAVPPELPPGPSASLHEVRVVEGGASRSESVANAIEAVEGEIVVVHDAARPLVGAELIEAVLERLESDPGCDAVVAAAAVTDTIKQAGRGMEVERTLDRTALWAAQTPQAFRVEALREALASSSLAEATDDAMLLERLGRRVVLHEAPPSNLKVTTPLDLRLAEELLRERG